MTVTAEVEIDFKEGKRTIEMELKEPHEIEDCEEGKAVMLNLRNGETYTGIFKGMDGDEDIMLGSLSGGNIALPITAAAWRSCRSQMFN
jgi:hypothetical protein